MKYTRANKEMSETVDRGIFIYGLSKSIEYATKYLAIYKIPINVIKRVLIHPDLRRNSDLSKPS